MRRFLDALYGASLWLAAGAICLIVALVTAQIALNIASRLAGPAFSWSIPSYVDIATYLLAAASFLALAPTLRDGVHIRVTLALRRLPARVQAGIEALTLASGLAIALFLLWFLVNLVLESIRFGDTSSGMLAIPLWLPQSVMALGIAVLAVALADTLVESLRAKAPILKGGDEA